MFSSLLPVPMNDITVAIAHKKELRPMPPNAPKPRDLADFFAKRGEKRPSRQFLEYLYVCNVSYY